MKSSVRRETSATETALLQPHLQYPQNHLVIIKYANQWFCHIGFLQILTSANCTVPPSDDTC